MHNYIIGNKISMLQRFKTNYHHYLVVRLAQIPPPLSLAKHHVSVLSCFR